MGSAAVIGIDVGTSGSKGVLVAVDGEVLAIATRQHAVDRPRPGWFEMDAAEWWAEFRSLSAELSDAARSIGVDVSGVGVSGMGPCVLIADDAGEPLRPAILYGVDSRATEQIAELDERFGGEAISTRCGSGLSTQAVGPKLLWLRQNEAETYGRARKLFTAHSWLVWRLTGRYTLDHHSASQSVPLYDIAAAEWYAPWFDQIAPDIERPGLHWSGEVVGTVTARAAQETGLPNGVSVVAGTIDAWAEAVSVGAQEPGDLMLMYGTTMFLINTVSSVVRAPGLWTTVGALPGTRSLAGGMATSGAITAWLSDLLGVHDFAQLTRLARHSPAGAAGLLMLPYFAGERTPIPDPHARGALIGLTLDHTRGDLYRAALEATAFGVRHNITTMREAGGTISRVVAVGGGVAGGLWTQIVSDITGLEQHIPREKVGAALGSAYLAASGTDVATPPIQVWNPILEFSRPNPALAALYDERYALYREFYESTAPIAHALAARQERDAAARVAATVATTKTERIG